MFLETGEDIKNLKDARAVFFDINSFLSVEDLVLESYTFQRGISYEGIIMPPEILNIQRVLTPTPESS